MEQDCDPGARCEASGEHSSQEGQQEVDDPVTSASSSNSDLPYVLLPEGERAAVGRRHSTKAFTGLRLFGRR